MHKRWILAASVAAAASVASAALAQDFPTHPVRIIVPWPASGNVDITARTVAPALSEALGQQVIVENRAGAAGRIGTTAVAKSPADGYVLLLGSSGTITAGRPGSAQAPLFAWVRRCSPSCRINWRKVLAIPPVRASLPILYRGSDFWARARFCVKLAGWLA